MKEEYKRLDDDKKNKYMQEIQLELLKAFSEFCEKNKLRYFLMYGTLIGAIRHGGFIPWDDDIDVMMPRPDYDKFIKLSRNCESLKKYQILAYELDSTYIYPFAKMCDKNSILVEEDMDWEMGIYIDIFPCDGLPETQSELQKYIQKMEYYKFALTAAIKKPKHKVWYKRVVKKIIYPFFKMKGSYYWLNKMRNLIAKYPWDSAKYVGLATDIISREIQPKEIYEEYIELSFEGEKFKAPSQYDRVLKKQYGNYMELPPLEERKGHKNTVYIK